MRSFARSATRAVLSIPAPADVCAETSGERSCGNTCTTSGDSFGKSRGGDGDGDGGGGGGGKVVSESGSADNIACPAAVYNSYIYNNSCVRNRLVEPIAITCGIADCICMSIASGNITASSGGEAMYTRTDKSIRIAPHANTASNTCHSTEIEDDNWSTLNSIFDDFTPPHHHTTDCVGGMCTYSSDSSIYSDISNQDSNYTDLANADTSASDPGDCPLFSPLLFAHDKIAAGWGKHILPDKSVISESNTSFGNDTCITSTCAPANVDDTCAMTNSPIPPLETQHCCIGLRRCFDITNSTTAVAVCGYGGRAKKRKV